MGCRQQGARVRNVLHDLDHADDVEPAVGQSKLRQVAEAHVEPSRPRGLRGNRCHLCSHDLPAVVLSRTHQRAGARPDIEPAVELPVPCEARHDLREPTMHEGRHLQVLGAVVAPVVGRLRRLGTASSEDRAALAAPHHAKAAHLTHRPALDRRARRARPSLDRRHGRLDNRCRPRCAALHLLLSLSDPLVETQVVGPQLTAFSRPR